MTSEFALPLFAFSVWDFLKKNCVEEVGDLIKSTRSVLYWLLQLAEECEALHKEAKRELEELYAKDKIDVYSLQKVYYLYSCHSQSLSNVTANLLDQYELEMDGRKVRGMEYFQEKLSGSSHYDTDRHLQEKFRSDIFTLAASLRSAVTHNGAQYGRILDSSEFAPERLMANEVSSSLLLLLNNEISNFSIKLDKSAQKARSYIEEYVRKGNPAEFG